MIEIKEIENTLAVLYTKNITYLKTNFFDLYNQICEFEKKNIENYFIDFIDNYFELSDINNKYYKCNSFYDAESRAKNIENSKAIFSLIVDKVNEINYNEENEISAHKFVKDFLTTNKHENYKSEKFIFIGTLLGFHINDIHKVLEQKAYLIIEPSIEIFRLSLFFTDYTELARNSKLFFLINEDKYNYSTTIKEFLEYEFSYNNYIKFELSCENYFYLLNKVENILISSNPFINAFSEELINLERGYSHIKQSKNGLLNYLHLKLFDKKPILILGAGPSLEKNQNFIKNNQNKFIIIAAAAALKRLEIINVIPDIIVSIDKKNNEILEQFNVDERIYKNSIIFLGLRTNLNIINKLNLEQVFFVQDSFEIIKNYGVIECVSVGDFIYKFVLNANAKNIYLLGIDAAITDKNSHDSLHLNNKTRKSTLENIHIEVVGNLQNNVKTNLLLFEIINSFEKIKLSENISSYNLSDGAKLKNCVPMNPKFHKNINLVNIEKEFLKNKLLKKLKLNSHKKFNLEAFNSANNELNILNKIKANLDDDNIIFLTKENPNSISLSIVFNYLRLINPYFTINSNENNIYIKKNQLTQILNRLTYIFNSILAQQ